MGIVTLHHGDALDVLRTLPDASVHAVVTDPPSGIAFMNMAWDDDRGGRAQWVAWLAGIMCEAYRVLKPGAHGLVWALPRTSHWTACALEDAGFEIREKVYHLFGNGFPKALDVSKAIDAELGATREVAGQRPRYYPDTDQWSTRTRGSTKTAPISFGCDHVPEDKMNTITAPATPEAAQWDGYKTALKPAAEEWILIRKPISERNVARNVLVHGTGGLNVDACRVPVADDEPNKRRATGEYSKSDENSIYGGGLYNHTRPATLSQGRYPPHVVFSHAPDCTDAACVEGCPVRALGEQSGVRLTGSPIIYSKARPKSKAKGADKAHLTTGYTDTGTAARFFPVFRYQAKPPPSERAGSTHPTQKSLALMEWLVKLVTAPGQVVLDCFMGSGTTGVAALRAGRQFIGIEMDAAYFAIAEQRITEEQNRPKQLDMFGEE
jgi:site-specific DNA-methyltransferase (adenine-specific)